MKTIFLLSMRQSDCMGWNFKHKSEVIKNCTQCGCDRTKGQRVSVDLCNKCYRSQRLMIHRANNKQCCKCFTLDTIKWYGDVCRNCWRKGRELSLDERIKNRLRSRVSKIVSGSVKYASAVADLGCSIEEFKKHLESRFQPGMTWDNYSHSGWHIDHIIPLSSFDLTDEQQLKKACHFTNLQPLWASDNIKKGDSLGHSK